jgi:hypothetical protein
MDGFLVGCIVEWDLVSGDLLEHQVHEAEVSLMALSRDKIATFDGDDAIRVFNLSTCWFAMVLRFYCLTGCYSWVDQAVSQ